MPERRMIDREKEARFNEVARMWKTTPEEEDAVREALRNELFALGFELYDDTSTLFVETFVNFFNKYDPNRSPASHYFNKVMKRRENYDENFDPHMVSLETKTEGSNNGQSAALIKAEMGKCENGSSVETTVNIDETLASLLSLILSMHERLEGRANNPTRINYFRMFFTDGVTEAIQGSRDKAELQRYNRHERDLFHALQVGFMDFFMRERCRTVVQLAFGMVKDYGELVPGKEMEEPSRPFPNDVYREYLNTYEGYDLSSDGSVSNQRGEYERFLEHSGIRLPARKR